MKEVNGSCSFPNLNAEWAGRLSFTGLHVYTEWSISSCTIKLIIAPYIILKIKFQKYSDLSSLPAPHFPFHGCCQCLPRHSTTSALTQLAHRGYWKTQSKYKNNKKGKYYQLLFGMIVKFLPMNEAQ